MNRESVAQHANLLYDSCDDDESVDDGEVGQGIISTAPSMTDRRWMNISYPKMSSRNFTESFHWSAFIREFSLHFFHPFLTPFVWAYIRIANGKQAASLFAASHLWTINYVPPDSKHRFFNVIISGLVWFTFVCFVHTILLVLVVLAFSNAGGSQNYTHEAAFAIAFKVVWSLAVGVKYGLYSEKLLTLLKIQPIPTDFISAEQLVMQWHPTFHRLMFDLRVASIGLPISISQSMISVPVQHPVARYCSKCKEVGDLPLCLLQPSLIRHVWDKLPTNNFHSLFWLKPPPVIAAEGKEYDCFLADGNVEHASYAPFMPHDEPRVLDTASSTTKNVSPVDVDVAVDPNSTKTSHRRRRHTLFVGDQFISASQSSPTSSPKLGSQSKVDAESTEISGYVDVPAGVLLAYCVTRSWNFGKTWLGGDNGDRSSVATVFLNLLAFFSYMIPGLMREFEPSICARLQCTDICPKFNCGHRVPMFVGDNWVDIVCHICWFVTSMFWFRTILTFVAIQMFELLRRAKLIEEWSDTLRHGRDSSLLTGMRLNSKDAVLTWYHCREVTRRFNSKINIRLASVMLFVFLIPVISFSALGFGMFDSKSAAAAFITPKFFAQTLFYSFVFVLAIVLQVVFSSKQNKQQDIENLMIARLVAHMEHLSCDKSVPAEPGVKMSAVEDVRDGLLAVFESLKLLRGFEPAKLFFVLPANPAVLGTIASGFFSAAFTFSRRFDDQPCVALQGVSSFYDGRFSC